jgi:predicted GNAT superfamily acetyltransferase
MSDTQTRPNIIIRPLRQLTEMHDAVELQKVHWGEDAESTVPAHMLYSLACHGGHVLAAYDGEGMVGVLIGFLGTSEDNPTRPAMANLQVVSKRMVVLPEYRSHGVGYKLKLAQRDFAVRQGVRLVTWTFDPLLAPNAQLNIRKLGAFCSTYLVDYYGTEGEGGLTTLGSSDRLLAEWWVTHRRVEERISGSRGLLTLRQYLDANTRIINATAGDGEFDAPSASFGLPDTSLALAEIPLNVTAMTQTAPDLARRWRLHMREVFQMLFGRGYMVTDFLRESHEGRVRAFYLLSYNGPQFEGFSAN